MELTLGTIVNANAALNRLMRKELPGKMSYTIKRNARKIEPELEPYNDANNDLIRKYGEEKEGQFSINTNSPQFAAYISDMDEVLAFEVEIDLRTINVDDLLDALEANDQTITAGDLMALEFMIVEKEEKPEETPE